MALAFGDGDCDPLASEHRGGCHGAEDSGEMGDRGGHGWGSGVVVTRDIAPVPSGLRCQVLSPAPLAGDGGSDPRIRPAAQLPAQRAGRQLVAVSLTARHDYGWLDGRQAGCPEAGCFRLAVSVLLTVKAEEGGMVWAGHGWLRWGDSPIVWAGDRDKGAVWWEAMECVSHSPRRS